MSRMTGLLAVGNGEPCPLCVKEGSEKPLINGEDVDLLKHLILEHKEGMSKELFGEEI